MSESAKRRCENPEWIASQIARGTQLDEAAVRHMYENGMTQAEIANNLHVSQKVVWRFMNRHGIKARKAAKRKQLRERINGKGTALWASEIEEFPIAVTKYHFGG